MDGDTKLARGRLLHRSHSIDELFTCPVCMEFYQDPRILTCGHHFCKGCLDGIYSKSERFGRLCCPTCRKKTNIEERSKLDHLPRPVMINELQQIVLNMVEAKPEQHFMARSNRICDLCISNNTEDNYYCFNCQKKLCKQCNSQHKKPGYFQLHRTEPLTPELFCQYHPDQTLSSYCNKCNCFCCIRCLVETHAEHTVEDVLSVAKESTTRLDNFIQSHTISTSSFTSNTKRKIKKVRNRTNDLKQSIAHIRDLLRNFDHKLSCVEKDLNTASSAALQTAVEFGTAVQKMNNTSASGQYLLDYANYMKTKASIFELIEKERDFEPPISDANDSLTKFNINIPIMDSTLSAMIDDLQKMMTNVCIQYESECLGVIDETDLEESAENSNVAEIVERSINQTPPMTNASIVPSSQGHQLTASTSGVTNDIATPFIQTLQAANSQLNFAVNNPDVYHLVSTFSMKQWVHGMALETSTLKVLFRTEDKQSPVKVYPYFGENIAPSGEFGRWVDGLDGIGRLCHDTKRDIIIAPCGNKIVRMDQGGYVMDTIKVGTKPRGIAYSENKDVYVISDVGDHKVYLVDPNTKKILRSFGSKGVGNNEFQSPLYVHVRPTASSEILVSDSDNNCIKEFDIQGNHVRTYGQPGHEDGQLWDPRGICTDSDGHVYVCDHKNRRLVKFWTENQRDHWQCVLYPQQLRDQPFDIAIDQTNSIMALQLGKLNVTVELYKFHKSTNSCDIC